MCRRASGEMEDHMPQTKKKGKSTAPAKSPKAGASKQTQAAAPRVNTRGREVGAFVFLLLSIFSIISYFSSNGIFIGFFSTLAKGLLGWGYYAVPLLLFFSAAILFFHRGRPVRFRIACTLLLSVVIAGLLHLLSKTEYTLEFAMFKALWISGGELKSGGALGGALSELLTYLFGETGAGILLVCLGVTFLLASLNRTISGIMDALRQNKIDATESPAAREKPPARDIPPACEGPRERSRQTRRVIDIPLDEPEPCAAEPEPLKVKKRAPFFSAKPRVQTPDAIITGEAANASAEPVHQQPEVVPETISAEVEDVPLDIPFMDKRPKSTAKKAPAEPPQVSPPPVAPTPDLRPGTEGDATAYVFPTLNLLSSGAASGRVDGTEEVRLNIERLEAAFKSFGVNVKISSYTRGPTVTRYEAELEAGVKLARLTSLADDIALSLGSSGVRIAAMPGKISTVGIEVPNKLVSKVLLRDIIDTPDFRNAPSRLTFAIGKNIGGEAIVGDIAKLPHMLVAGTTGSGKSVCLNSLILSILYKSTPEEVRFIMIDPKMVEFRIYNGIPHLLVPVVTDVKKAAGALQWAVVEMMKRYRTFSEANARDLESYNKLVSNDEEGEKLPQIIVVIDELADLMLTAAKEVEESICRVAQMGRAAGVHLVIATQSPRADVITGLMKANIPSRIALKVANALESRIILDAGGNADKLVGNGDMLYAPIGAAKPLRVQGTWVSDAERESVVAFIKESGDAKYSEEVIHQIDKAAEEKESGGKRDTSEDSASDYDELLPQAVEIIFESGQASVSMLQRRLKLGYARAARIVDQMEQMKIVGPFEGSKPRQMLVTRAQWHEMQLVHGTAPLGAAAGGEPAEAEE